MFKEIDPKSLIGTEQFGKKIIDAKREEKDGRIYVKFICPYCGKEKWVRSNSPARSCGCISGRPNNKKYKDITGKKFGRLTAINPVRKEKYGIIWNCQCECGNFKEVLYTHLIDGGTRSCGCLLKEISIKNGEETASKNCYGGTNVKRITGKASKNSKSGVTGVCFVQGKWYASIGFRNKCYYLGIYNKIEDAIAARKDAENKILNWCKKEYPEKYKELLKSWGDN